MKSQTATAMTSSHLATLKGMCVDADINNDERQRDALGWALARLTEFTGTKVADALSGKQNKDATEKLQTMQATIDELESLVEFICKQNRADRGRMENKHRAQQALDV
jgi:hypothetical protein